jgi:hypothetical protein
MPVDTEAADWSSLVAADKVEESRDIRLEQGA